MAATSALLDLLLLLCFFLFGNAGAQMPGFVSIDCGGTEKYTDEIGLDWAPDTQMLYGETADISVPGENRRQYSTVRYFPADNRKYCYTLNVLNRTRYLVRATFLYGNFDSSNVYPKFDISLGATPWSTIVISDANTIEIHELILLASYPTISVCLSNATTGRPFISTLELRQFNGSLYYTEFETRFFLGVSARINFGAESIDSVRDSPAPSAGMALPNNHFFPTAYIAVSGGSFCPCEEAASALKWPRAVCRERRFKIFDLDVGAIGESTSNSEVPMMQAVYSSLKGLVRIHNPSLLITLEVTDPNVRNALKMAAGSSVNRTTTLVVLPRSAVPKVLWMADLRPTALPIWNKMRISVNIITQNRATSLKRLLDSLERAFYVGDEVPISFNMDSRVDEATLKMMSSLC